jgi:hypothetical protein
MLRRPHLFFALPAGVVALTWISAFAEQPEITIDLRTTFDYPGTGNSTTGVSINDRGEIAGFYTDSGWVTHGFVRFRNGNFMPRLTSQTALRSLGSASITLGLFPDTLLA